MSLASIGIFEQLNDVCENVFHYQKGDLLPMYISKPPNNNSNTEIEIVDMDLPLLYEPSKQHYVVITDLLNSSAEP